MKGITQVLSYAEQYRRKFYTSIVLLTIGVVLSIVPYFLTYHMIMGFIEKHEVTLKELLLLSAGILLSMFLSSVARYLGLGASHEVAYDTLYGMRKRLADKVIKMPLGLIHKRGSGDLKKHFVENIEDMELILAHMIPEGLSNLLVPIAVVLCLTMLDWRMALLSLATLPIGVTAMGMMMKTGLKKVERYYQSSAEMNANIIEYVSGMEVIKVFNQTTSSFKKYSTSVENYQKYSLDWYRQSWNYMAVYAAFFPATLLFMVPFGTLFYIKGTLGLGTFLLCTLLSMSMGLPLMRLVEFAPLFPILTQKAQKIEEVFKAPEISVPVQGAQPKGHTIEFDKVTFAYEEQDVLKNVSFVAKENTVTALVGESGAGKSTVAKLLVRFWDIQRGEIRLGDVPIQDISFETLMDTISYVSQEIFLFNTTIMENIRMGRPDATDAEVIQMAKIAQCHEFIMEMEKGYDTLAGDSGDKLSGGQKQRIAIARALLKKAPVVILDEATSFADPENEDKIQAALSSLIQGKTLIVIAHRLSTITGADNILLMENGEISAQGTHDALLASSRLYSKMWQAHMEAMVWDITVKGEQL